VTLARAGRATAPSRLIYGPLVRAALREDLGDAGDVTTNAIVPTLARASATLVARAPGRIAGLEAALFAFHAFEPALTIDTLRSDGDDIAAGETLATVRGSARGVLGAERTALNLLARLCGIATMTAAYVRAVAPYPTRIVCTRKTTPGLRALEKYAVLCGGGANHRFGLYDAVLIKDNHIAVAGGVAEAIAAVRAGAGHLVACEVEVDTLTQLHEALAARADAILLDNMTLEAMREAVRLTAGRATLEASGSIDLDSVGAVAATGVDLISVGRLTHSAPALDIGLDIVS
jgi:nicotinate-nucleotide pyrophosphorylase (carboxylating)